MEFVKLVYLLLLVAPVSIFIHEFGHAIAAWLIGADRIYISIGVGKKGKTVIVGKVHMIIYPLFFLGGVATSEKQPCYTRLEIIFISIFGPFVSGVVVIICWFFYQMNANSLIQLFLLFNAWLSIINLIPFRYQGKRTDGYVVFNLLLKQIKGN
ncbi:zinc metalloprotease [Virgibacillus salexigens]|uniref:M50 family metallopeptidase n=1 Tax=Virgibacillus massiliensis TaxID=1462526 RepID=UPI00136EDE0C|nr:M50 family metallopeptidase [Virgibacillus massiliensis]